MSPEPRYVFDTNAVVSALLFDQSPPGRALHAAVERGRILLSEATFAELGEVLARPRFDRYIARELARRGAGIPGITRSTDLKHVLGPARACEFLA